MIRECSLKDISDGRTYDLNDMVKADTGSCIGCHKCCTGMGTSIVLDPYDAWRLKRGLGKTFQELLDQDFIELNMVDGLILPNLKMNNEDKCSFLNQEGRCDIHPHRPGICRIFPLGRVYDGEGFKYFLQKGQCIKDNNTKVKVKKWIDTDSVEANQKFINSWHYFIREIGDKVCELKKSGRSESVNDIAMFILNSFYIADSSPLGQEETDNLSEQIYDIFINRIEKSKSIINEIFA